MMWSDAYREAESCLTSAQVEPQEVFRLVLFSSVQALQSLASLGSTAEPRNPVSSLPPISGSYTCVTLGSQWDCPVSIASMRRGGVTEFNFSEGPLS